MDIIKDKLNEKCNLNKDKNSYKDREKNKMRKLHLTN